MKEGRDRIRITCYDEKDERSCSIVVSFSDKLYICGSNRILEIAEHELYYVLRDLLDKI